MDKRERPAIYEWADDQEFGRVLKFVRYKTAKEINKEREQLIYDVFALSGKTFGLLAEPRPLPGIFVSEEWLTNAGETLRQAGWILSELTGISPHKK